MTTARDETTFEERADQIDEKVLLDETVAEDHFDRVHQALVSKGLVLIQGPRGCGKTHLMRFTALKCQDDASLPLALYVSFNRYLRLEPLLNHRADAVNIFQSWVLASIVLEADALASRLKGDPFNFPAFLGAERADFQAIVSQLERQIPLTEQEHEVVRFLTIQNVVNGILAMCDHHGRSRAVVLLDDAALTLTPEYMVELFDIIRVLKNPRISPKASVYPGSTEYGPRFHANHEGRTVSAWLPVDSERYVETMREIANKRYPVADQLRPEVDELLIYASFGIPRAYLTMLRSYHDSAESNDQARINSIVQDHNKLRLSEFRSLSQKVPRLETLVSTGELLFGQAVEAIREANDESLERNEKQLILGLETSTLTPIVNRMINLVIEAGLLFEYKTEVSHGAERSYRRFTPHLSALIATRAFSGRSRGNSPRQVVESLRRKSTKHPVRRKIETLLDQATLEGLRFNLPPCENCGTRRLSETQLFCHACGRPLVTPSTFDNCMKTPISSVPGLSDWQIKKLQDNNISTVGDFVALQDPGTELRNIKRIGPKRASGITDNVNTYVDEFMS
ncbi:hypothetical protein AMC87_PC00011 (plasmid) [Rhizobium phaseoli]|uniref:ATP-binding protein n=1 Tax=Rhizobium TaxID=379 RepID=UPI0007E95852|nr:ATP-binding protein [Rhizobium phaseoli]ANL49714.1 hypothetical protein AMC87_PC00011 [Rhizobium phaseoli]